MPMPTTWMARRGSSQKQKGHKPKHVTLVFTAEFFGVADGMPLPIHRPQYPCGFAAYCYTAMCNRKCSSFWLAKVLAGPNFVQAAFLAWNRPPPSTPQTQPSG